MFASSDLEGNFAGRWSRNFLSTLFNCSKCRYKSQATRSDLGFRSPWWWSLEVPAVEMFPLIAQNEFLVVCYWRSDGSPRVMASLPPKSGCASFLELFMAQFAEMSTDETYVRHLFSNCGEKQLNREMRDTDSYYVNFESTVNLYKYYASVKLV